MTIELHYSHALNALPFMSWFEVQDIVYAHLFKCLKEPADSFSTVVIQVFYSQLLRLGLSILSITDKLKYNFHQSSVTRYQYFNRVDRIWNTPYATIDLSLSTATIKN